MYRFIIPIAAGVPVVVEDVVVAILLRINFLHDVSSKKIQGVLGVQDCVFITRTIFTSKPFIYGVGAR